MTSNQRRNDPEAPPNNANAADINPSFASLRRLDAADPHLRWAAKGRSGWAMFTLLVTTMVLVVCGYAYAQERVAPEGTEEGFVESGSARIHYEVSGTGEPLVLIHGSLLDLTMWDHQAVAFSGQNRVIRYDTRGHGLTESPKEPFSHVEDFAALLDELGVDRCTVVGLSMGSGVALQLAVGLPDRISRLVLVSPGLPGEPSAELLKREDDLEKAFFSSPEDFVGVFLSVWLDGPSRSPADVSPEVRSRIRAMALRGRSLMDLRRRPTPLKPPVHERLGEITQPTLVVRGSLDMPDTASAASRLVSELPNATEVVVTGTAHFPPLEAPAGFNEALSSFLEEPPK